MGPDYGPVPIHSECDGSTECDGGTAGAGRFSEERWEGAPGARGSERALTSALRHFSPTQKTLRAGATCGLQEGQSRSHRTRAGACMSLGRWRTRAHPVP